MKIDFYKKINILGILISLLLYFFVEISLFAGCGLTTCPSNISDSILLPLQIGSLWLCLIFILFLPFQSYFFKIWLKYIFLWGFPLSIYLSSQVIPRQGQLFGDITRSDYVEGIGYIALSISLILILTIWLYTRVQNRKIFRQN